MCQGHRHPAHAHAAQRGAQEALFPSSMRTMSSCPSQHPRPRPGLRRVADLLRAHGTVQACRSSPPQRWLRWMRGAETGQGADGLPPSPMCACLQLSVAPLCALVSARETPGSSLSRQRQAPPRRRIAAAPARHTAAAFTGDGAVPCAGGGSPLPRSSRRQPAQQRRLRPPPAPPC